MQLTECKRQKLKKLFTNYDLITDRWHYQFTILPLWNGKREHEKKEKLSKNKGS